MNNISNNNNDQANKDPQDLVAELTAEVKKLSKDIDKTNANLEEATKHTEKIVNKTVKELDEIYNDLDKTERKAKDEFDSLIINQAKDLDAVDSEDEE